MPLTAHQQGVFDEVITLLRRGEKRVLVIGSAGTGKTFTSDQLVAYCKRAYDINKSYNNGQIFALAPTNKALAVLTGKIHSPVQFKTVHGALNMRPGQPDRETGFRKFIRLKTRSKAAEEFRHAKIGILDECSMLNTELLTYLEEFNFPIIFMGDDKQINPVGEPFSPIFHKNYPTVELKEIVRQGAGNPIIDLSRDLDLIYFKQPSLIDGKGYTYSNAKHILIENLAEVNGTDEMKYLAFTNDDVDNMNKLVRERRYGVPKKIEQEETIVFNSPFGSFYTNQEVKVEDVDIITDFITVPKSNTRYDKDNIPITSVDKIKIKYYRINNAINVVHEHSENMFNEIKSSLTYNCKTHGWDWRGKYFFEEQFADITYNHALTIHKSQGSTYKEAIVNIGNVHFNKNVEERTRLLYTAITRASDLVVLNNVK